MPDIHIQRDHGLGLPAARALATEWAAQAERKFDMECRYEPCEEGEAGGADELSFKRAGVSGTLSVTGESFVLDAKLGFLLGSFKDRIEAEIAKNLDALLAEKPA
ncbi:polyhydroxyalkanoic acid synthase [Rhodoferax koreense]|uniref:Polyhydroxyalkanoic acid synthase n=1 Tax=Rhodoferax koreensis TaxID=1842727 RepID=A0A1P8JRX1_9BURK|nr:polyhydroxyalkanoic acid system family protein [Rhodoferax koreense]APW36514.1 polyhydroxyalkanoic acid synthase [Rhodoferax koreense]